MTLTLHDFSYRYPGAPAWALRRVTLEAGAGLLVVAGESGSGKSTLLRVCNGLVPHFHGGTAAGEARLDGLDVLQTPTRVLARRAGFLFQDCEMQSVYTTVERDVAFGLENLALARAQMIERVDEALERLGIADLRTRAMATLSGGERQRSALAGVLAMRPTLLALDEPLAQLDPDGISEFMSFLAEIVRDGTAVLLAEHRLEAPLAAATSLAVLDGETVHGPAPPGAIVERLPHPPDLVALGRHLGWRPPLLDLAAARARLPRIADNGNGAQASTAGAIAWALSDATLAVAREPILERIEASGRAGEVTVLMGRNGSGKTTLLRAVAGLLAPRSGIVERAPGRVAYLPQNPAALLHRATVRSEVELTLHRAGERDDADAILARLGLSDAAGRYPRDLSSGQRQRAAVAAVLAGRPRIALLDEPTRGMDGTARTQLASLVRDLASDGASVVLATHDSELAAQVGDRVLRLDAGRVHDLGPPQVALRGDTPYATQIGRLFPDGPVTLSEALALL